MMPGRKREGERPSQGAAPGRRQSAGGGRDATARDVMQTSVISVGPDMPLTAVNQLFVEEGIHGAPVVDETDRLLGVISTIDLLRAVEEEHDSPSTDPTYFRELLEFSGPDWSAAPQDFQDRLAQMTVADAMQTSVVTVSEDTPISEVAKAMRSNQVHRVIVVTDGQLSGIVSTFDLIALLE
jgi:CBS domain-containing protein